ncbi:MAG: FtsH protease activity modulator HflK [Gemmatimonadales bacterium]|nr:MAG: FtsH protease activity modulator HflK [Gemmatimonadales bacterium]
MDHMKQISIDEKKLLGALRRFLPAIGLAVVGLVVVTGSIFQVEAEEVGVITRFGKVVRQVDPGLHLKVPVADRLHRVPIQRQLKEEFGFRTLDGRGASDGARYRTVPAEALMLTGDLNVVHAEWVVQYRVVDPKLFLFEVRNPAQTLRALAESVMRQTVGDRTVTEVLTVGRQEIEDRALQELNLLVDQYAMGIRVVQVIMQDATPPAPVRPSWDSVNGAQQQRERMINEAWAEYNRDVPRAEGEALEALLRAEGYALDRVNRAGGEVDRFNALYVEYRRAPDVTRTRLMLEAQETVLGQVKGKIFVDPEMRGIMPLFQNGANGVVGAGGAFPVPVPVPGTEPSSTPARRGGGDQ